MFHLSLLVSFFIFVKSLSSPAEPKLLYIARDICEESKFYQPYVKIFSSRYQQHFGYPPEAMMDRTGFMDLRNHSGILCINGPAFIYSELVYIYATINPIVISVVFKAASVKIYTHECYSFNRLKREAYKARNVWVMKETKVFGNKFYGVVLIGKEKSDYRHSDFIVFNEPDFGYAPSREILDGASVALVINSTETNMLCYHVEALNVDGVISGRFVDQPIFCRRADKGQDFDIPWHQNVMTNEAKWGSCGSGTFTPDDGDENGDNNDVSQQLNQADLMKPVTNLLENLNESGYLWKKTLRGHSLLEEESRTDFYDKNVMDYILAVAQYYRDVGGSSKSTAATSTTSSTPTLPDYQRYSKNFMPKECTLLPTYSSAIIGNCKPNTRNPCSILNHIMTIETVDWKAGKMKAGNWRKEILTQLQRIYAKVCPQVSTIFAPAVTRVFEYYLNHMVESDSKAEIKFQEPLRVDWVRIQVDLDHCSSLAKPLPFSLEYDDEKLEMIRALKNMLANLTSGRESLGEEESESRYSQIMKIQDELNGVYLQNPYKIMLKGGQESIMELKFHSYVEAAEIDFNLDWAIDSFWKVISTVIGYCYNYYDIPDSGTFIKLYDLFTQDFLEYVIEIWQVTKNWFTSNSNKTTQGEDVEVYDQLMGEFVRGSAAMWIDACNSGVYHLGNISHLKPLRPLHLIVGEDNFSDISGKRPIPNFFVKNVNF